MNFLTHLFFSQNQNEQITVGLIIGYNLKAGNSGKYNESVIRGTKLNKVIDDYFKKSEDFQRSMSRLSVKYSRYREFIVKVYYDHLLAVNWNNYSENSLENFSEGINQVILDNLSQLPYKVRKFSPQMVAKKWLAGLTSIEGTHQYIKILLKTERFSLNLEQSLFELVDNYNDYKKDFEAFFQGLKNEISQHLKEEAFQEEKELVKI